MSLPNKETLLSLIDTYVLKVPKDKGEEEGEWPFNVFEEIELLDSLRVQIEERHSVELQMALFDSLFGLKGDSKVSDT